MKQIILTTLVFISLFGSAQQEVIIIDKGDLKEHKKKELKLNDNTQVFKFAPLNMLVGEINFSYEKQVSQKGSIEIELGPTLSNIGLGLNSHYIDPYAPSVVENSGLGFVTAFGYRFYPLDDTEALNRFYVSPVLKFKLLNSIFQDESGYLDKVNAADSRLDFYFNFGYQVWASKSFSVDFYGGVGLGYRAVTDYRSETVYEDNEWKYSWVKTNSSGARYVANLGIKIGIGKE